MNADSESPMPTLEALAAEALPRVMECQNRIASNRRRR